MDYDRKIEIITVSNKGKRRRKLKRIGDTEIILDGRLFTVDRAYEYIQKISFIEDDKTCLDALNLTKELEIALFELYFGYGKISSKYFNELMKNLYFYRFAIRHGMTKKEIKKFIADHRQLLKALRSEKER